MRMIYQQLVQKFDQRGFQFNQNQNLRRKCRRITLDQIIQLVFFLTRINWILHSRTSGFSIDTFEKYASLVRHASTATKAAYRRTRISNIRTIRVSRITYTYRQLYQKLPIEIHLRAYTRMYGQAPALAQMPAILTKYINL